MKRSVSAIAFFLIIIISFVSCGTEPIQTESTPASTLEISTDPSLLPEPSPSVELNSTLQEGSTFEIHFIDVGQADCTLVLCDNEAMLIDGGNVADSDLVYTYLKNEGVDYLNYIVCTHAHEDHVGGLSGALNYATADIALCPVTNYDSKAFNNFVKYLDNTAITVPSPGDTYTLGSASFTIYGPITPSDEPNNTSIVLMLTYGDTSFLFTGDAERDEEQDILDAGYDLQATVLKVGHHGSDTSTTYPFLREIMPEYAVISCGQGNSYGHPTENTLSRLRDANVKTYRTDMQGSIICTSDGNSVSFHTERNENIDTLNLDTADGKYGQSISNNGNTGSPESSSPSPSTSISPISDDITYILNINTHKFHYPSCSSVKQMNESNKQEYTGTRDEVIEMGYDPCGRCHP